MDKSRAASRGGILRPRMDNRDGDLARSRDTAPHLVWGEEGGGKLLLLLLLPGMPICVVMLLHAAAASAAQGCALRR